MSTTDLTKPKSVGRRRKPLNELAFDELTPEAVYWLGYILADGCITTRLAVGKQPQVVLQLASSDHEHIAKFQRFLGSDYATHTAKNCCMLAIPSRQIVERLESLGITRNKSCFEKFPSVPDALQQFLLRGILDGDGCFNVYFRQPRTKIGRGVGRPPGFGTWIPWLSLVCGKHVCEAFRSRVGLGSVTRKARTWTYQVTGKVVPDFVAGLYESHLAPSLDRKYKLAKRLGWL